jgi:uncharacterized protein with PIN domain
VPALGCLFHSSLAAIVAPHRPGPVLLTHNLPSPASVKDCLEAMGVPHTEIDLILLDGAPVGFDRLLAGGESLAAYPVPVLDPTTNLPLDQVTWPAARLQPRPLARQRLACDQHLGKLARLLRVLGFDVSYSPLWREAEIAGHVSAEDRGILTCSRALLKRKSVTAGLLVLSRRPDEQVCEVVRRFGLPPPDRRFGRCSVCNAVLQRVPLAQVAASIPPRTRAWRHEYSRCPSCGRLYWEGTHVARLRARLARILTKCDSSPRS